MDANKIIQLIKKALQWVKSHKPTKDTAQRAARTFVQAAISYIAVNVAFVDFTGDKSVAISALKGLAISALAAGIAAVMNLGKTNDETESEE